MSGQTRRLILSAALVFAASAAATAGGQGLAAQPAARYLQYGGGVLDAVVTILVESDGQAHAVGSGLIMRGDGLVVTPYHLIKDARNVQVRLRNGETFDRAVLVVSDERRDVAVLRIPAAGLYPVSGAAMEEGFVGATVTVVTGATLEAGGLPAGVLSSVSLADEVPGAGRGYRVLRFTAPVASGAAGGVLVDDRGRAIGLVTSQGQGQPYAVPLSSVVGLVRSVGVQAPATTVTVATPGTIYGVNAPYPIPQSSVSVPQRPTLPLEARGPGSVVVKPSRPVDVLLASKTIYVTSRTKFFKPQHLVNALNKRAEVQNWGLSFVDDPRVADLVLTLDHVLFTYKFTFSLAHQRTGVVVATGSRVVFDGNLGADDMAARVVEKLTQVRAQPPSKPEPAAEGKAKQ